MPTTEALEFRAGIRHTVVIFLVSRLLEVGYTRIVSYKLWYYYTYLVIGLALLGIGSGGVFVVDVQAGCARRRPSASSRSASISARSASRRLPRRSRGSRSTPSRSGTTAPRRRSRTSAILGVICFVLFATFIALGVIVVELLGRAPATASAASTSPTSSAPGSAACSPIPLITRLGPPDVIMLVGARLRGRRRCVALPRPSVCCSASAPRSPSCSSSSSRRAASLPDVRTEDTKVGAPGTRCSPTGARCSASTSSFGRRTTPNRLLAHDGTFGSGDPRVRRRPGVARRASTPTRARSRSTCSARRPSAS